MDLAFVENFVHFNRTNVETTPVFCVFNRQLTNGLPRQATKAAISAAMKQLPTERQMVRLPVGTARTQAGASFTSFLLHLLGQSSCPGQSVCTRDGHDPLTSLDRYVLRDHI
jgi:hypothetical protein